MADETAIAPVRPGYKTTEFWLSLFAMLLGAAYTSGALGDTGTVGKIAGLIATILGGLGYTVARTSAKKA